MSCHSASKYWSAEKSWRSGRFAAAAILALGFILARIDDFQRRIPRNSPLLNEAAFARFQKFVKQGRGPRVEFSLENLEHFAPAAAFAINDPISGLELQDLVQRIAIPPQADFVQADHLRPAASFDHDKRRHVLRDFGDSTDHR